MSEKDQLRKMLREVTTKLSEHCDSVRIFVTRHAMDGETDATACLDDGAGNFAAQLGQVHEWITIQDQYQRNWAIRRDKDQD